MSATTRNNLPGTYVLMADTAPLSGAFSFGGMNEEEVPFMRCSVHPERVR